MSERYGKVEQQGNLRQTTATDERESDIHLTLEMYKLMLEEWHRQTQRTHSLLGRTQSICLVLLGAEAYLAATSQLMSWLPVLVVLAISLFGVLFVRTVRGQEERERAREGSCYSVSVRIERKLVAEGALDEGYLLRAFEISETLARLRATKLTKRRMPQRLQKPLHLHSRNLFVAAFIIIPLAFALVTYLALNPATHFLVQPLLSSR